MKPSLRPYIFVAACAPLGTLVRIALSIFEKWLAGTGSRLFSVWGAGFLLPNILGCVAMSYCLMHRNRLMAIDTALYVGLTSGFCGATTTYSTFAQSASVQLVQGRVVDSLLLIVIMNALALASLNVANTFAARRSLPSPSTAGAAAAPGSGHAEVEGGRGRSLTLPLKWRHTSTTSTMEAVRRRPQQVAAKERLIQSSVDDQQLFSRSSQHYPRSQHTGRLRSISEPPEVDDTDDDNASMFPLFHGNGSASDPSRDNAARFVATLEPPANNHATGNLNGAPPRSRALSRTSYSGRSAHRRLKSLGTDFMSEEEHLRFVARRVQKIDRRGNYQNMVENFASEEAQLSAIRDAVLLLADLYRTYEVGPDEEEGGGGARGRGRGGAGGRGGDGNRDTLEWATGHLQVFLLCLVLVAITVSALRLQGATQVFVALALSPLGALLRYRLGLRNAGHKQFPIYTFAANMLGCVTTAAMHAATPSAGGLAGSFTAGVAVGFAGSLSTVSTLYAEARVLNGRLMARCK